MSKLPEQWVINTHKKTVRMFGLNDMFKKFISELFELRLELSMPEPNIAKVIEEIADCMNMEEKMEIHDVEFDFASPVDTLTGCIEGMIHILRNGGVHSSVSIPLAPTLIISRIITKYDLDYNLIETVRIEKMKRTADRLAREKSAPYHYKNQSQIMGD